MRLTCLITFCALLGALAVLRAEDSSNSGVRCRLIPDIPPVTESDVQKNDPETQIIAPIDYFRDGDDDFLIKTTAAFSGNEGWVKIVTDWVEPITPPNGSPPPVRPDQMILVELKGEVTVTLPDKTTAPAREGQDFPSGATVSTGDKGTAAVFIGGINSVRLGPGTRVSCDYRIFGPFRGSPGDKATQRRTTMVRLETGEIFCKIGYEPDVTQYFEVSNDKGSAVAAAGDFLARVQKEAFEVGVVRGSVRVVDGKGREVTVLNATNRSGLQIARVPEADGQLAIMTANSRLLEVTVEAVAMINHRIGPLLEKHDKQGVAFTEQEQAYLDHLPTFIYLLKVRKL